MEGIYLTCKMYVVYVGQIVHTAYKNITYEMNRVSYKQDTWDKWGV